MAKVAELKKKTAMAVAVAAMAAFSLGVVAFYAFPSGNTSYSGLLPKPLLGYLSSQNVICSLTADSCVMTIENNSTTAVAVNGCYVEVVLSRSTNTTTTKTVEGTIGGAPRVSAHSSAQVTCSLDRSDIAEETIGSYVSGFIQATLVGDSYMWTAGTLTSVDFSGEWT